jgi:hypothetical protein
MFLFRVKAVALLVPEGGVSEEIAATAAQAASKENS